MSLALAITFGVVIGITLGSLGAGGSILAVPVLAHVVGLPVGAATATSLVAVGAASLVAATGHRRRVRWDVAGWFVGAGAAGSVLGAFLGDQLSEQALLLAFSALILVAAHRMLTACPSCTRVGEEEALAETLPARTPTTADPVLVGADHGTRPSGSPAATAPKATGPGVVPSPPSAVARGSRLSVTVLAGAGVGVLTGLFGVGGGFVIVPALTLALGLNLPTAIATSLVIVAGNALAALGVRGPESVDWPTAAAFTVPMLAGSALGSVLARRLDAQRSLRAFAGVLVLVAIGNALAALV